MRKRCPFVRALLALTASVLTAALLFGCRFSGNGKPRPDTSAVSSGSAVSSSASVSQNNESAVSASDSSGTEKSGSGVSSVPENTGSLDTALLETLPNTKAGWGPGYGKNGGQPPINTKAKALLAKYEAYCIGAQDDKNIYLTFDCGYEGGYTEKILDTLKEKGVKAVFFVTLPYAKANPKIVRRMIDEGHIIGNHTATHPSMPEVASYEKLQNEVLQTDKYVSDNFNYRMTLFRFPSGEYSERTLEALHELGYHSVFWSFAYLDYDVNNQKGRDYALNMITSKAHNGAIYLLHVQSKDNTNALAAAIDSFREKGYTLSQLTDSFVQQG